MFDEFGRTWKFAVPGMIGILLGWGGIMLFMNDWKNAAVLVIILAIFIFFVIGGTNYWRFTSEQAAEVYRKRKEAEAITPRGMMLDAAKGVHPETIRLILGEQARRWGLVSGSKSGNGKPYKVLMARPRVTEEFLVYFLRNSTGKSYMAKHGKLSDGDKSWDPQGIVTTYEMFDDLESLLFEETKATRPFGNTKPGYWLGEWDARSVGLDYGIDIDEWTDGETPETPLSASTQTSPQMASNFGGEDGVVASNLHRASVSDFQNKGVPLVQSKAMEGLLQTQAMRMKLNKSNS